MSDRPSRRSALLLWCIALSGQFVVPLLMQPFEGLSATAYSVIANLIFYLIFLGLPALLYLRRRPGLLTAAARPNPVSIGDTIVLSATAVIGMFFFNYLTILWMIILQELGLNPGDGSLPLPGSSGGLMLMVLVVAALPGVFEELLFRGAVLPAYEKGGTKRAVWISALLFALTHGTLAGLPTQLLTGAILALVVIDCNSIYAGMIYHTVHNASSIIAQLIIDRTPTPGAEATGHMLTDIGGLPGVVSVLISLLLLGFSMYSTLRVLRVRAKARGIEHLPRQKQPLERGEGALLALALLLCAGLYAMVYFIS